MFKKIDYNETIINYTFYLYFFQEPIPPQTSITLSCTADFNSCSIHGPTSTTRSTWSFFYQEDSFNSLCESLNKRGFRESDLQQTLINLKEMIVKSILRCPIKRLNPPIEGIEVGIYYLYL